MKEQKTTELYGQVQEMEIYHQELLSQAQKQVKEMEAKEKNIQEILDVVAYCSNTLIAAFASSVSSPFSSTTGVSVFFPICTIFS